MAKKIRIDIDFNQDNFLVALSCHKKDYWVAFQLNDSLGLELRKMDDFGFYHSSLDQVVTYPIFYHHDSSSGISWYLIGNYHPEGKLFPALRTTDYFVLLNGQISKSQVDEKVKEMKKINGILLAHQLETGPLKEFGNFLSDLELHMIDSQKEN